ncbi:hypothetical protein FISHEDRAFT_72997 [Fistulina hepatica ATCC 64428]|uniref:Uncharacterized protein n=1 Tax=Fistulina hepatica ATCC 64428 TaxID=1128425 RepID=A0A0D7ADH7_9AGAR|nr:hypothetical protein FISHEDRAFT_72997 [Fistulina hepatica ATCC 64428]
MSRDANVQFPALYSVDEVAGTETLLDSASSDPSVSSSSGSKTPTSESGKPYPSNSAYTAIQSLFRFHPLQLYILSKPLSSYLMSLNKSELADMDAALDAMRSYGRSRWPVTARRPSVARVRSFILPPSSPAPATPTKNDAEGEEEIDEDVEASIRYFKETYGTTDLITGPEARRPRAGKYHSDPARPSGSASAGRPRCVTTGDLATPATLFAPPSGSLSSSRRSSYTSIRSPSASTTVSRHPSYARGAPQAHRSVPETIAEDIDSAAFQRSPMASDVTPDPASVIDFSVMPFEPWTVVAASITYSDSLTSFGEQSTPVIGAFVID